VEAAVGLAIANLALQFLKEDAAPFAKFFRRDIGEDTRQLIFRASKKYAENYTERHGKLKVTCVRMDEAIPLEEVYTAVKLLNRSELRYFESAAALEEWFRESGRRGLGHIESEKQDGITVANQEQYLMVLGSPGIGKSTYLRKVGLEALKYRKSLVGRPTSAYQHDCVPVLLELQRFQSTDRTILQRIAQELETCEFPKAQAFTEFMLNKGKMLVLLDGLDEVPKNQENAVIIQIRDFVDRYSDNRFIASCRIAAYKGGFQRFKDVVMAEFEDEQIQKFIRNWFRKPKDIEKQTAEKCWKLLQDSGYNATKELAKTPLLLTLLCAVYDKYQHFPKNRASLYYEALEVVLREWAAEKRIHDEPIYQELPIELEREFLAELAFDFFKADRLFFEKQTITQRIKSFLVNNLNAPKHLDSETVIKEIEIQQGILVERASETYSFSHLTFQEYLTAKHILDTQQVEWLVDNHLADQQWGEVFLLVAGLMQAGKGADPLLMAMEQRTQGYLTTPVLRELVQWANIATQNSQNPAKPVAKRACAILLARSLARILDLARTREITLARTLDLARAIALDFDLARALDHDYELVRDLTIALNFESTIDLAIAITHDLTRDLAIAQEIQNLQVIDSFNYMELAQKIDQIKQRITDASTPKISEEEIVNALFICWSAALKFDIKLLADIDENEKKFLKDYLYSYELMVRCKEAAVRVSPEVWEAIEARMVTVPEEG